MGPPAVELEPWAMAALNVAVWLVWSAGVGYVAHRRSDAAFAADTWLYRLRPFERGGAFYADRLRIKRWKDRLPEAGALFAGGVSKRTLAGRDRAGLERFAVATRRAEWTHWVVMAVTPAFLLWNPWWVEPVMVAYALAANVPCLLIQRYNRGRLLALLARASISERREGRGSA
jgi:glycosyl-4,4'-diaponeurosporenoate acyltransferase